MLLYALGAAMAWVFVHTQRRAREPVLPLVLWRDPTFTLSNIAVLGVAMGMFGAIYFVPIFVQGVIGDSAANSGTVLVPLMLAMVSASILGGRLITATGRYKAQVLAGLISMGVGFFLLTRMSVHTSAAAVMGNLALIGAGLGLSMQTFVLIVQNTASREHMGVATSATQLFRSIGGAAGVAIMGSLMTHGLAVGVPRHLSAAAVAAMHASGTSVDAASVLDPARLGQLPPEIVGGVRAGLAEALHSVYLAGLPFVLLAFAAACFIKELPLRRTAHVSLKEQGEEAGKEVLAELAQAGPGDAEPILDAGRRR
jgi:predicted MFS family arabinose efflux permease